MARVQRGDHQAFAHLVERHSGRFYAVAYRMVGNSAEAEDIVQDCFLKLWNKPDMWNKKKNAKFTTWFYRVITNAAIDKSRRYARMISGDTVFEHMPDGKRNAEEEMYENQTQKELEEAIQSLPDRQKAALNLCFYEGLSNKDAAVILNVNVKALESLLMRAKTGVRDYLMNKGFLATEMLKGAQG